MDRTVTFYHSPQTRSSGVLALLEELDASYDLELLKPGAKSTRSPEFLKINPMGKVPALVHAGQLVTEQVACYIYLADLYPEKELAPTVVDSLRGPYLRWLAFYGSSFEPAMVDKALKREPGPPAMVPYGTLDSVLSAVHGQLARGPWLLGERFTAADVLWGALGWMTMFGILEKTPDMAAYIDRVASRPAIKAARAKDEAWVKEAGRLMQGAAHLSLRERSERSSG